MTIEAGPSIGVFSMWLTIILLVISWLAAVVLLFASLADELDYKWDSIVRCMEGVLESMDDDLAYLDKNGNWSSSSEK